MRQAIARRASIVRPCCCSAFGAAPTAAASASSGSKRAASTTTNKSSRGKDRMDGSSSSGVPSTSTSASDLPQQAKKAAPMQGELVSAVMMRSPQPLVDIGINLTNDAFRKDRDEVLQRAAQANVGALVVTGTCVRTSQQARDLCVEASAQFPHLYFTAGVHPHDAKSCDASTLDELRQLAAHPRCVAIGECGLDFNRNYSPPDVQEVWFDKQVALAKKLRKPLFMHCRDAATRFSEILRQHYPLTAPAVVHCFTGSKEELQTFIELGLHIGITGWVCDDRPERGGAELASLLPSIPKDRLMIETDGPYLIPRTIKPSKARPGRNEPALLPHVLQTVATALGEDWGEVALRTTRTAKEVFNLPL